MLLLLPHVYKILPVYRRYYHIRVAASYEQTQPNVADTFCDINCLFTIEIATAAMLLC